MNNPRINLRQPTMARCRAWWDSWDRFLSRLGEVHVKLSLAETEEDRWKVLWCFDDNGRHVTHPWREWNRPTDTGKRLPATK